MAPEVNHTRNQLILDLKAIGFTTALIAFLVGCSKSWVNYVVNPSAKKRRDEYNKKMNAERPEISRRTSAMHRATNTRPAEYATWRRQLIAEHAREWTDQDRQDYEELERMRVELENQEGIKYHIDHIRSLFSGGRHHPSNMQLLTQGDNIRKGAAQWPEVY